MMQSPTIKFFIAILIIWILAVVAVWLIGYIHEASGGVCFNSPELAEQYFKDTGINGTVPCPDFTISGHPKDESGK